MIYYVARQVLPPSILKVSVFHYNVMVLYALIPKNAVPFIYNQCVQIGMGGRFKYRSILYSHYVH